MYNMLEYSDNYSLTVGSSWSYYRDEVNDEANENSVADYYNNNTKTSKSFEYKTKNIGSMTTNNSMLDTEFVVPLKCLSKF